MLKNHRVSLKTQHFHVRTLDESINFENYLSWFQDPLVQQYIEYAKQSDLSSEKLKQFVSEMLFSEDNLLCGIFSFEGRHLGNIKFGPVDFEKKTAYMGILLGDPQARGKGAFAEAFGAVSQHLYKEFGIKKFILGVSRDNASAVKAYEKVGFKLESGSVADSLKMIYLASEN